MYKILQDDDSHYYIVPEELEKPFRKLIEDEDWGGLEDFINQHAIERMNYHLSRYRFPEVIEPGERTHNEN